MEIYEQLDIHDCPKCGGAGLFEEEGSSGFYVTCMECGSHTVVVPYKDEKEKLTSAKRAAELWNYGKVIAEGVGE